MTVNLSVLLGIALQKWQYMCFDAVLTGSHVFYHFWIIHIIFFIKQANCTLAHLGTFLRTKLVYLKQPKWMKHLTIDYLKRIVTCLTNYQFEI